MLIVVAPFADYRKGDQITDQAAIDAALKSNPQHVVRVAVAPAPVTGN